MNHLIEFENALIIDRVAKRYLDGMRIAISVPTDYVQAKERRDQLEAEVLRTGNSLKEISGGGPMGLTPESVRSTQKWKNAKRESDGAMAELQEFNTVFVRRFKHEIAQDRKNRGR